MFSDTFSGPSAALCGPKYSILNWALRTLHMGPPLCHFSLQLSQSGPMLMDPRSSWEGDFSVLMPTYTWELHLCFFSGQCPGCGPQFYSPLGILSALSEAGVLPSLGAFPADSGSWQIAHPRARLHTGGPANLATSIQFRKPKETASQPSPSLLCGVGKMSLELSCRPGLGWPALQLPGAVT